MQCLLGHCEIRDKGGCYCACRYHDYISSLKRLIDGTAISCMGAVIYIPDERERDAYIASMLPEDRELYLSKKEDAIKLLPEAEAKFKELYCE